MDFRGGKRWTAAQRTCRNLRLSAAKRANANWTGWETRESKHCTKWARIWYDYFFITLDENLQYVCMSDDTQLYTVKGECEYLVNVKGKNSVILVPGLLTWWDDNWTELDTSKNCLAEKSSMKMSFLFEQKSLNDFHLLWIWKIWIWDRLLWAWRDSLFCARCHELGHQKFPQFDFWINCYLTYTCVLKTMWKSSLASMLKVSFSNFTFMGVFFVCFPFFFFLSVEGVTVKV